MTAQILVAGSLSFIGFVVFSLGYVCLMGAGIVPKANPPQFLFIWIAVSFVLLVVGGLRWWAMGFWS